ncbi:MAG: phosphate-starvation-inducible PsiE family protein [Nitrososphaeria archaeon]
MIKHQLVLWMAAIIIFALLFTGLVLSVVSIIMYLPHMLVFQTLESTLQQFITDILNLVIILELMALVSLYFAKERVKLEYALDAAIIFLVREIIIYIYTGILNWNYIAGFTVLLITLMVLRTMAVKFSPDRTAPQHQA